MGTACKQHYYNQKPKQTIPNQPTEHNDTQYNKQNRNFKEINRNKIKTVTQLQNYKAKYTNFNQAKQI